MSKETFDNGVVRLYQGDARQVLRDLPAESVHCVVTSPPYWGLRDYGLEPLTWGGDDHKHEWGEDSYQRRSNDGGKGEKQLSNAGANERDQPVEHAFCPCGAWRGSLGLEPTIDLYVQHIVEVFREVRRVLREDGTLWLNLGDSYAASWPAPNTRRNIIDNPMSDGKRGPQRPERLGPGLKNKDLCMMPARVALALQADGWWLRSDIVWSKPNPMPESVTDRPTRAHEYVFLLTKAERYYYDADAIREPILESSVKRFNAANDGEADTTKHQVLGGTYARPVKEILAGQRGNTGRNKRSVWEIPTEPFSAQALHGGSGDSGRIGSPDCPIHGVREARVRVAFGDGQRAASLTRHSPGNDDRPSLELGFAESATSSGQAGGHEDGVADIHRNRQSHRTGLESAQHDMGGVQSESHNGCIEPSHVGDAMCDHTPESKTSEGSGEGETAPSPSGQKASGSGGRLKCSCPIIDHFAVFPQALVEPCILAGTSQRGVCPDCGAPWERQVTRTPMEIDRSHNHPPELRTRTSGTMTKPAASHTTGWRPTCDCGHAETVPAMVLDPFAGSGTVAYVAQRLGRLSIGIDLSADYLALAEKRMRGQSLPMVLEP